MKVLQVNCVYNRGSTGKIVYDIHQYLINKNFESIVCYGRLQSENEKNIFKTSSEILAKLNNLKARFTGIQYGGCYFSTRKLINIIKREKPNVVHLHCLNGFFVNIYKILDFLKKNNIKTVITLHAEFMYTVNCSHAYECNKWKKGCGDCPDLKRATNSYFFDNTNKAWMKMLKAFQDFENLSIVSVSSWLEKRAKESKILSNKKHTTILNGIETEKIFYPRLENINNKLINEKIIIHVTANFNNEIKGGKYIIELAKRLKSYNIKFLVIGNDKNQKKLPENIIDIGKLKDQNKLAYYYSKADLAIITSKKETFSMVCAEALSCGTPIVGFKAGAPEEIALKKYSEFVEYGDIDELEKCVLKWLYKKDINHDHMVKLAQKKYSKIRMCERYIDIYENR
ncbi:glycosyltransferase [Clostridium perfringens]